jgi:hypothetical protein
MRDYFTSAMLGIVVAILLILSWEMSQEKKVRGIQMQLDLSDQFVIANKLYKCQLVTEKVTAKTRGVKK